MICVKCQTRNAGTLNRRTWGILWIVANIEPFGGHRIEKW
jgi:hypothetical protein